MRLRFNNQPRREAHFSAVKRRVGVQPTRPVCPQTGHGGSQITAAAHPSEHSDLGGGTPLVPGRHAALANPWKGEERGRVP